MTRNAQQNESEAHPRAHRRGALVRWLLDRELLRGPFLFADYWASVLGLEGVIPDRHLKNRWVDRALYRLGLDRPDLEIPRTRSYLILSLIGPFLFPFRSFRRLGKYRFRYSPSVGEDIVRALDAYRLRLEPVGPGRVRVRKDDHILADDVLDPFVISGFSSLFWAANKLPLASFSAILLIAILTPLLDAAGLLGLTTAYWIPAGFPLLTALLYLVYREWGTAILGALPVIVGRYLLVLLHPGAQQAWGAFFWALAALFVLYLFADWFFIPRPIPPVLMLYSDHGPGSPYDRDGDRPYWLRGHVYWVWRYLILTPAELNKFWERDWERVELWIRADGEEAGTLEWVVTDLHYRELWIPFENLGSPESLARARSEADRARRAHRPGIWLVEVDANLVFHYPYIRTVSFLPEKDGIPAHSILHLAAALWKRPREDRIEPHVLAMNRARLQIGTAVLGDVPEVIAPRTARHLFAQPWTYWRYPLGAARRREEWLYEYERSKEPPLAADPTLQIKQNRA